MEIFYILLAIICLSPTTMTFTIMSNLRKTARLDGVTLLCKFFCDSDVDYTYEDFSYSDYFDRIDSIEGNSAARIFCDVCKVNNDELPEIEEPATDQPRHYYPNFSVMKLPQSITNNQSSHHSTQSIKEKTEYKSHDIPLQLQNINM